jgi:Zn-dependent protease with chaperone function
MYGLLAVSLSLAGLLVIHTVASLLAPLAWRACSRSAESWRPSTRARLLLLLRLAPGVAAALAVGGVLLPAYLHHEPRQTTEIVTLKLGIPAVLSLCVIGYAIWRGCKTHLVTRRMIRNWLQHAEPVDVGNAAIPAYRFPHSFPVIAVVGVFRPRLFIARQVFQSLSRDEIAAAVAHENGHLAAWDIVKSGLLRWCRDLQSILPLGRRIDRAWIGAAELAADEHAARHGASVALDLASALVKVARLAPREVGPTAPAGAALFVQDMGSISRRVLRLIQLAARVNGLPQESPLLPRFALGACFSSLVIASMVMVYHSDFLVVIHSAMECVVSVFQ